MDDFLHFVSFRLSNFEATALHFTASNIANREDTVSQIVGNAISRISGNFVFIRTDANHHAVPFPSVPVGIVLQSIEMGMGTPRVFMLEFDVDPPGADHIWLSFIYERANSGRYTPRLSSVTGNTGQWQHQQLLLFLLHSLVFNTDTDYTFAAGDHGGDILTGHTPHFLAYADDSGGDTAGRYTSHML